MISQSIARWLATVALVLVVIGIALGLNAWRDQEKHTKVGAQMGLRHTTIKRT